MGDFCVLNEELSHIRFSFSSPFPVESGGKGTLEVQEIIQIWGVPLKDRERGVQNNERAYDVTGFFISAFGSPETAPGCVEELVIESEFSSTIIS